MNRRQFVIVALALLLLAVFVRGGHLLRFARSAQPKVALAYDPAEASAHPQLRKVWEAAFSRVPHVWIAQGDLAVLGAATVASHYPVVVLPDSLDRWVSDDLAGELHAFARSGGTLIVVSDAGTQADDGHVLPESVFGDLAGGTTTSAGVEYVPISSGKVDGVVRRATASLDAATRAHDGKLPSISARVTN